VTTNGGTLVVNAASLLISANNTNREYGAANPVFSCTATGFVNGDTAGVLSGSPALTTTAMSSSPVGNYVIAATNGTLNATNYGLIFTNGIMTVYLGAPVISPAGVAFSNSISVTLADDFPGAGIYYTLDGTTPGVGSTLYTGPFVLTNSANVSARAVLSGAGESAVTSSVFYSSTFIGAGTGLIGAYYSSQSMTFSNRPTLVRTDAVVDFDWGSGSPDPSITPRVFTVMWTGAVQPQFNETYTFYTTTEDGARLWVNGQLIINEWAPQPPVQWSGSIPLTVGTMVPITMEYFENSSNAAASLSWSSPSTPQSIIPSSQLFPNYPPIISSASPVASNGGFQLQMDGLTGKGYVLQASTNILNWVSVQTNAPSPDPDMSLPTNWFNFIDPGATNYNRRFYRLLQEP
jgi:hypothetical protein